MYILGSTSVAAVTKRYRLSGLNNLHWESLSILEAGSLTLKSAGPLPPEVSLLGV